MTMTEPELETNTVKQTISSENYTSQIQHYEDDEEQDYIIVVQIRPSLEIMDSSEQIMITVHVPMDDMYLLIKNELLQTYITAKQGKET